MTITIHKFKASGKWYETFLLNINIGTMPEYNYQYTVSSALRASNRPEIIISPISKTTDTWFLMTIINDLPIIYWIE